MIRLAALVLFDLGATGSFVSLALSKRFDNAHGELDCHLQVEIAYFRTVRVSMVHRGSLLEVLGVRYFIELVPISLRETKVIVGMDWLSPTGGCD